jgi:PAS domain S-box-containing protein
VVISLDLLSTLTSFSVTIDLGVVAVADTDKKEILFASKMETLIGYSDLELVNMSFNELLPVEFRSRHDLIMAAYKLQSDAGQSRNMRTNKAVAIAKNGDRVPLTVAISYHAGSDKAPGIFLALIRDPDDKEKIDQFDSVQNVFTSLLKPGVEIVKHTRATIAKKYATTGGIFGFILWTLSQVTPIGTAAKAAYTAFNWKVANSEEADIGVFELVNDETRLEKLQAIESALKKYSTQVIGVAYYRLVEYGLGSKQLKYIADSATTEEVWFFDITENRLILSDKELSALSQQDCILKMNAGYYPSHPEKGKFSLILCPTIKVVKDPNNPGLKRIETVNVAALAIPSSITELEPFATLFWRYLVNLENLY